MCRKSSRLLAAAIAAQFSTAAFGQLAAFPGAQGFGGNATGGRGGSIYVVSNYNNSGAGSFEDAVSGSNRIIVFAVGGYVSMSAAYTCKSNLTILGQTAPGQGIAFMGREVSFNNASNDIVQYIRAREGSIDPAEKASINLGGSSNMILDHVDAEFAQYDNIDAVGSPTTSNITLQNSIVADAIKAQQFNMHTEGVNTTYLNNVFTNAHGRSVLAKANSQFVNNAIYDYGYAYTTGDSVGVFSYDIINNDFVPGPSTGSSSDAFYQLGSNQSAYSLGNLVAGKVTAATSGSSDSMKALAAPWSPTTQYLPTLSTTAAWAFDAAHSGALYPNGDGTFSRDPVDAQIISQLESNGSSGSIMNTQTDDGLSNNGFGTLNNSSVSVNTLDTVPFAWLQAHGMSTTNTAQLTMTNPLGYDMIEQYAQQVGDQYASQTATAGDWGTAAWSSTKPGIYDHALIRGMGTINGLVTISSTDAAQAFSISIGGNGPATGETLNVTGGSLVVQDTIYVGDQNNGLLNVTGGTIRCDNVQLGNTVWTANGSSSTTYVGAVNLTGGILTTGQVVLGGGVPGSWTTGGSINWSGGTLQSIGQLTVSAPAVLRSGGGILDTNAGTATISGVMSGSGNFTVIGGGKLSLTAANTYTGTTTIRGATLAIGTLANGGIPSELGASSSAASNLILDGGILAGVGSTDRSFTLTANGGSIDNSGGTNFTGPGVVGLPTGANTTLTLTGSSTAHNTFNLSLADPGGGFVTSVLKTGNGKWTFSADGVKTYSGQTHITAGQLEALSGDAFSHYSDLNIDTGTSLEMHDNGVTINGLLGSGAIYNSFVNATKTLTIGAKNGGGTWAGNINSGATLNVVKQGTGTEIFSAANTYVGDTTVTGGTLTISATGSVISAALYTSAGATLNLIGSAASGAVLNSSGITNIGPNPGIGIQIRTMGSVTIGSAGQVNLINPGSRANRTLLVAGGITFGGSSNSWQGKLDLAGNDLVVNNGSIGSLSNQLAQGYNTGKWNGTGGFFSSTAASNTMHLTSIGIIQNSVDGTTAGTPIYSSSNTFDGYSPVASDVLAKYTYYGDTNLDGTVNSADYSRVDNGYLNQISGWFNGDFNYDGVANGSDYTLIDNAFNTQGAALTSEMALPTVETAGSQNVPEPTALGTILVCAARLLGRRRGRVPDNTSSRG